MAKYGGVRKAIRKAGQAIKKRYKAKSGGRKSTGGYRVAKMAKDIMYLKSVLNPEKKRIVDSIDSTLVGQVNANTDGGYFEDITPIPSQGVTYDTRNGASIKLHSSMWHFQIFQAVGVIADIRMCVEMWAIKGEPYTGFTWRNEHWLPNPFVSSSANIYDFNALTNPDNYMKGRCIARRYITLKADQTSTVKNILDFKIPVKYNNGQGHHIRYNKDSTTVENGQLYLTIRADRGNISSTTPSTLSVADVGVNTGVYMSYNVQHFFYDN